jgi:ribonuclease P protein component
VVRRGRRAGRRTLVVHVLRREAGGTDVTGAATPPAPRVGFVVSRAVGDAVTRNRVKRRLRHHVRDRLDALPLGVLVAVRALPPAAEATYARLGEDLDSALQRALDERGAGESRTGGSRRRRREGTGS